MSVDLGEVVNSNVSVDDGKDGGVVDGWIVNIAVDKGDIAWWLQAELAQRA